jgi:hypothetical protein
MKIISDNPLLLDEVFNDLKKEHIKSEKTTKKIEGAMGDITTYIELAELGLHAIDTFIAYLAYRLSQKNNYIHFTYDDGTVVKLNNLSKKEQEIKLDALKDKFADLKSIDIG